MLARYLLTILKGAALLMYLILIIELVVMVMYWNVIFSDIQQYLYDSFSRWLGWVLVYVAVFCALMNFFNPCPSTCKSVIWTCNFSISSYMYIWFSRKHVLNLGRKSIFLKCSVYMCKWWKSNDWVFLQHTGILFILNFKYMHEEMGLF